MHTKHRHAHTRTHTRACTRESLMENHSPFILRLRTREPLSEFSWCGEMCAGKPVGGQDSTGNFVMMASRSSVPWTPGSAPDGGELTAPRQGPAGVVLVPQVGREDAPTGPASASGAMTLHSGPMGPTLHKASSPGKSRGRQTSLPAGASWPPACRLLLKQSWPGMHFPRLHTGPMLGFLFLLGSSPSFPPPRGVGALSPPSTVPPFSVGFGWWSLLGCSRPPPSRLAPRPRAGLGLLSPWPHSRITRELSQTAMPAPSRPTPMTFMRWGWAQAPAFCKIFGCFQGGALGWE